jgi:uncharacterized membrane protein
MTEFLIFLFVVYIIGGIVWAIQGIAFYHLMSANYERDERQAAARRVIFTPIWPLYGLWLLSRLVRGMWEESGLDAEFRKFQRNIQKGSK